MKTSTEKKLSKPSHPKKSRKVLTVGKASRLTRGGVFGTFFEGSNTPWRIAP